MSTQIYYSQHVYIRTVPHGTITNVTYVRFIILILVSPYIENGWQILESGFIYIKHGS